MKLRTRFWLGTLLLLHAQATVLAQAPATVTDGKAPTYTGLREMNPPADPPPEQVTVIVNARLIDGRGGPPVDNACIVIRGNKIDYAGPTADATLPPDVPHKDVGGKAVLPGLIDTHFHSQDSVTVPVTYQLWNGITSFRDPGHPFKYYDLLLASDEVVPRVFLCGGHLDAEPVVWADQAARIATAEEARQTVREHVARGASSIKIYLRLPLEHIAAACETAAELGVPVTAHLELVDADKAIEAGVAGIEHITSFGTTLANPELTRQFKEAIRASSDARQEWRYRLWQHIELPGNPRVDPLLKLIVHRGTFVSGTLAVFEAQSGSEKSTAEEAQAFANMLQFLGMCHQQGAKIVVGSHTATKFADKRKAYLRELELMAEAGMKPLEIIAAATLTGAEFLGIQDRLGTLEAGKLADLIIVNGDPSSNISQIDHVTDVMLNGQWVTRD